MPRLLFAIALGFAGAALAAAAENYVTITAPSTPLRVGASHMASPVGTVTQGQRLDVLSTEGNWIRVAQPGTVRIPRRDDRGLE